MRNNTATVCARVGIATLASLGVFAVAGGAGFAAPSQQIAVVHGISAAAPTPEECSAIRQQIEGPEAHLLYLQELLAEAPPAQKPGIIRMIHKVNAQIGELQAQLEGCPA